MGCGVFYGVNYEVCQWASGTGSGKCDLLNPALAIARDPAGLQVMEEIIFPGYDRSKKICCSNK